MVQFTVVGDGQNAQDFQLNVDNLYWGPNQLSQDLVVYTALNTIENINSGHTANLVDGTDLGDIELSADFTGDTLLITVDNIGAEPMAIEDMYIDAPSNEFQLINFEPVDLAGGMSYDVLLSLIHI